MVYGEVNFCVYNGYVKIKVNCVEAKFLNGNRKFANNYLIYNTITK